MARRSRQSILKRQRELKRLEKAAAKRQKREERRQKTDEDDEFEEVEKGPPIEAAEDFFAVQADSENDDTDEVDREDV